MTESEEKIVEEMSARIAAEGRHCVNIAMTRLQAEVAHDMGQLKILLSRQGSESIAMKLFKRIEKTLAKQTEEDSMDDTIAASLYEIMEHANLSRFENTICYGCMRGHLDRGTIREHVVEILDLIATAGEA